MEIDSVAMSAQLTSERAQSLLTCLRQVQSKNAVPLKLFQRLLGHMASAAAATPLGLLHMRPLHGTQALSGYQLPQPAVKPSPRGQTSTFYGPECP